MRIISEDALQKQITARRKKCLEYLTVPEAAELAGVEPATIAYWYTTGKKSRSEKQERLFVFQEKHLNSGYWKRKEKGGGIAWLRYRRKK